MYDRESRSVGVALVRQLVLILWLMLLSAMPAIADTCPTVDVYIQSIGDQPRAIDCVTVLIVNTNLPPNAPGKVALAPITLQYAHRAVRDLVTRVNELTSEELSGRIPTRSELDALHWYGNISDIPDGASMQPSSEPFYQTNGINIDNGFLREASAELQKIRLDISNEEARVSAKETSKKQALTKPAPYLWYAPGETQPTCHLENKSCPCKFDDMASAISHQWGPPMGRGTRATALKMLSILREQDKEGHFNPLLGHTPLRDDATEVVSFANRAAQRSLTIFGRDRCVTQTVEWTPLGAVVLDSNQYALLH
jgi:hypothetical protein